MLRASAGSSLQVGLLPTPLALGSVLSNFEKFTFPACVSVTIQHHQDTGL